ncbi:MAG: hypothetical protein ACLFSQ_08985 [Candidatus Zixiibacteriota bacterium]
MRKREYLLPMLLLILFFSNLAFGQLECSFIVDLSPPYISPGTAVPADGSILDSSFICISYDVTDDLSGVDPATIETRGAIHNSRTGTVDSLIFTGTEYCQNFNNCDSVVVCVHADDQIPDLGCSCPPNHMEECFWFLVQTCTSGPYVDSTWPGDVILSCEDQNGVFRVLDSAVTCSGGDYAIDPATFLTYVEVRNGGVAYSDSFRTTDAGLTWDGSEYLTFDPSLAGRLWEDGDTVTITLVDVENDGGCGLYDIATIQFVVDLTPPEIVFRDPSCGTTINTSSFTFDYTLEDAIAGLNASSDSFSITVNRDGSEAYTEEGIHTGEYTVPFTMEDGDTIEVCISGSDDVDESYCPANVMADTCCEFYVSIGEPYAFIVEPRDTNVDGWTISSCECQPIIMGIYSSHGLDTASGVFFVNDDTMSLTDPRITFENYPDSVVFTFTPEGPAPCWSECDEVAFGLITIDNGIGAPLVASVIDTFIVDRNPPDYFGFLPYPDTVVTEADVSISVNAHDSCTYEICDDSYLDIIVNDTDSSRVMGMSTTGGPFENGDIVRVCASGCRDNPDYCDPNIGRECWQFEVAIGEISARLIEPVDVNGDSIVVSNCECQPIIWTIDHALPLEEDSIAVNIDGTSYTLADPELSFSGDTLTFTPSGPPCWEDGDSISFEISRIIDETGVALSGVAAGYVIIDLSGPYYFSETPADGSTISTTTADVSVDVADSICDDAIIDSLAYTINGIAGTTILDSLHTILDGLAGGDTIVITAYAHDGCSDYCDPNYSEFTWTFDVEPTDVNAVLLEPIDENSDGRVISNCECQHIDWFILHSLPLDSSSIEITVDDIVYNLDDAELDLIGDTIRFTPAGPAPCWTDADSIYFEITNLEDELGGVLTDGAAGYMIIDLSPPVFSGATPTGSITTESSTISITADDAICDTVVYDSMYVEIGGIRDTIVYFDNEIEIDGLEDGDIVNVCAFTSDDCADYCEANDTSYCWTYEVLMGSPVASVIEPVDLNSDGRVISNCDCQPIIWTIDHEYALIMDSIMVNVDGFDYYLDDSPLSISSGHDTLYFNPPAPCYDSGDSIAFELVTMVDSTGGRMEEPVGGYVIIDLEGPEFTGATPVGAITASDVTVEVSADDEICPTAVYDSLVVSIDGIRDAAYAGVLEADLTGLEDGNTVEVCGYAHDGCADYCEPNESDFCWTFDVLMGDPGAVVAEPIDINADGRIITACECDDQRIVWRLIHTYELVLDSIDVTVNGDLYEWGAPELTISTAHDSLYYTPTAPDGCWEHGDSVTFSLDILADSTGGMMTSPSEGWAIVDLEGPVFSSEFPTPGSILRAEDFMASCAANDDICDDVVMDSFRVTINGVHDITYDDALSGDISGLSDGDSVSFCGFVHDGCHDYCGPHFSDTCWHITIAELVLNLEEPIDLNSDGRVISNCECQPIVWSIEHSVAIIDSTIEIDISRNGEALVRYTWGDPEISFSAGRDSLYFTPTGSTPCWEDEDSIYFEIIHLHDLVGHPDASESELSGSFIVDLSGPVFSALTPAPGDIISDADIDISVAANDNICPTAVYDSMIVEGEFAGRLGTFTSFDESITMIGSDENLTVIAYAHDDCADYCDPNYSDTLWQFQYRPGCDLVVDAGEDAIICYGETIQLDASHTGGTAPFTYSWEPAGMLDTTGITDPWTVALDSTTTFVFTTEDTFGCMAYDSVRIRVSPELVIDIMPEQYLCPGDTLLPLASPIEGGIEPLEIIWTSTNDDTIIGEENPIIAIDNDSDDQTWYIEVTDSIGCWASAEIDIIVDCGQPVASFDVPGTETYSCDDQVIIMHLEDTVGIDESTIEFNTGSETIGTDDDRLGFDGVEYLYFHPDSGYFSEGEVTVIVENCANINGIEIENPVSRTFNIDLTPPDAEFLAPPGPMGYTQETQPELLFNLDDNMTGVDPASLRLTIDGNLFEGSEVPYSGTSPNIIFPTGDNDLEFTAGDSVHIVLEACDSPVTEPDSLYCPANCSSFEWFFYVYLDYDCDAVPIPFTPDASNNNYVQFEYPGMTTDDGTIYIFNVRNVPVAEIDVTGANGARENARWHGNDNGGNPQKQGLYLYVIEVDGEIVCNGTITLAR